MTKTKHLVFSSCVNNIQEAANGYRPRYGKPDSLRVLKGASKAILKALPHIDPNSEDSHFVGEWLGEIDAYINKIDINPDKQEPK